MKILGISEMKDIGLLKYDSPNNRLREDDVEAFWKSGALAAEVPKLEQLTMQTEITKYKKAIRAIAARQNFDFAEIRIRVMKGKIYLVRPELVRLQNRVV